MKAYSLIGTVYMGLLAADKTLVGGYKRVGNCYPFSLQVATESKSQLSRLKESAGQTLHSKVAISGISGSLTLREWDPFNLAWALSGAASLLTGAGGTVSAESVTTIEDEWVELANKNVTPATVTISGGVLNTDFEVNGPLGLLKILSTGGLTAGATEVSYTHVAETGYKVEIGSQTQIRVAIKIDGENEYDSSAMTMEFDSVVLASSAEINLISAPDTEYEELPFTATFETLTGNTSPGRINGVPL